ncbi:type II toxin-antitoxin system VapB family antitoxin [Mesorhizobium sp. M1409]|uniref:type II toxin-antitoxin system VapB family antitoxin n=1 Tax=unclassified Mesorhizobium TaxID=325217 RepID=UPI00333D49C4
MNLRIRDPRARELALELAAKRNTSMTKAVIEALESELKWERGRAPLAERLAVIAADLRAKAGEGGQAVSKDEIGDMWGGGQNDA